MGRLNLVVKFLGLTTKSSKYVTSSVRTLNDGAVFRAAEYMLMIRRDDNTCDRQVMATTHGNVFSWWLNILQQIRHQSISHIQGGPKNVTLYFCPYLCQLLIDFQNSFTGTLFRQFAIIDYCRSHHTVNSSPHYLVKYKCKWKLTIITNKHFGKIDKKHF